MRGSMPPVSSGPSVIDAPTGSAREGWHQLWRRGQHQARSPAEVAYGVAAIATTLIVGLAAGLDPTIVIAGLVGLAIMIMVLVNVTVGLMIFLFVAFVESLPTLPGAPSLAKLVGLFLVLGWLGAIAFGRPGDRASLDFLNRNVPLAAALCLFLSWVLASQIWAEDVAVARSTFFRYALNFALFPIVYVAIRTPRHIVMLFGIFATGSLLIAAAGFQSGGGEDGRLSGGGLNPNELGALLAVGAVLAMTLACYRVLGSPPRVLALGIAVLCGVAVFLTGSRGALVGLAASIVATPFLAGPGRRLLASVLVIAGGIATTVWLLLLARANTLEQFSVASGGSGRVDLWTIALRMFNDNPVTGAGAGNFPVSAIHYLLLPGVITRPEYIIDKPKVTHNIYLQVLAEMGLVGIFLFLGIIVICLVIALRAARLLRRQGDRDTELLTRGLLIALAGLLVAEFFSSALYSKQLYILLAAAPPIFALAVRRARSELPL